jgi:hypothetical protein
MTNEWEMYGTVIEIEGDTVFFKDSETGLVFDLDLPSLSYAEVL